MNVLLVDDDGFTHEVLELLLTSTGFSLKSASNVAEAMSLIAADAPDIIITDAMMPGESGFSMIEKLKSNPGTEGIPVILCTILERPDGSVMDASGKADIAVSKPLYVSNILEGLETAKHLIESRNARKAKLNGSDQMVTIVF